MTLRAQWVVTAEIMPGQKVEELTKVWQYTSRDHVMDRDKPLEETVFQRYKFEANIYAASLQDPAQVNIVKLEFMWL